MHATADLSPQNNRPMAPVLFTLQWLVSGLSFAVALPVAVGPVLGLNAEELTSLVQRSIMVSGLGTFIQTTVGHRLALQEGPAGLWAGVILVLASVAPATGKSLEALRADLQTGLIAAGLLLVVLGALRLVRHLAKLMTPLVTGTYLLLLSLQVSGPFLKGMAGVGYTVGGGVGMRIFLLSLASFVVVIGCMHFGRGLVRSLAVLIGLGVGWLLFVLTGSGGLPAPGPRPFWQMPDWFGWGAPTVDAGLVAVSLVTGLLALVNLYGAMAALGAVTGREIEARDSDRGGFGMGLVHTLSGAGATAGIIVLTHSAALVGLMGTNSLRYLRVAGLGMAALGFLPGLAAFFAALPTPVGYAALFALFVQVAGIGLQSLSRALAAPGAVTVAGVSLMAGVGSMLLPVDLLAALPLYVRYVVSNGLVTGTLVAVALQWLLRVRGDA